MNEIFNTPFESGLRALLILYSNDSEGLTIDRIVAYDFMTIYGGELGLSERNLHGINHYSFSELSSKRTICSEGVKCFVLDGLISFIQNKEGFIYSLTPAGKQYVEKLESNYKEQFLKSLNEVQKKYDRVPDTELVRIINNAAVNALRRQS